jgi:hypothetical protein
MTNTWNWRDEILRRVDALAERPPTSITELLDMFETIIPPTSRGFDGLVDDPRATKETPMAKTTNSTKIGLYTCPACKQDVNGTVTLAPVTDDLTPDAEGYVNVRMQMTGMRADAHDCTPRVAR